MQIVINLAMKFNKYRLEHLSTQIESSCFSTQNSDVDEFMFMVHATNLCEPFAQQLDAIIKSYKHIIEENCDFSPVFIRFFVSDTANQAKDIYKEIGNQNCPISLIEQAPLDGSKIAMWVYSLSNIELNSNGNLSKFSHNSYSHLWSADKPQGNWNDSRLQTKELLVNYVENIKKEECSLLCDTIRTWFFVQNVDVNYAGVVTGRNEIFDEEGLTVDSHFITSTGIQGRIADHRVTTVMDAYTVKGLKQEQIQFLYAPTHLNNTAEYGVRFERGTAVHYGDRSQVFISGTASINNKGEVVHIGDIRNQTLRMWENVETLLAEANCSFDDLAQMIVYLRDISDYAVVKDMFDEKFPNTPKILVLAPVCRPTWLIEMECIAVRGNDNENYANF